ncbi:MAG: bifunctional oligoribonuclease/PAP phosphatase NrnA [Candidatus Lernaella stagnicola]|nr:bifunctional oligoribonuclease/PAP phosphatase NrnA [Candidatus Lernaella stagnicola]
MINQRNELLAMIRDGESFFVTCHENPDGDAVGAALALALALRSQGKQAVVYNVDEMPNYLTWLPGADLLVQEANPADFDTICILDCGASHRVGPQKAAIMAQPRLINVDHHITNDGYGHANVVLPKSSSTCEILYDLMVEWGVQITPEIATNLYLGIYTDTMMFQNAASCPNAYKVCGELVAAGADFLRVAKRVYIDSSAQRLLLLGRVLSTLRLDCDGRIAGVHALRRDLEELGLGPDDMEVFVEYPRSVIGAEVAYLLREEDDKGLVKGSLRASNDVDVSEIAKQLNGGGHKKAAGFRVEGSLEEIRRRVVLMLTEALERERNSAH